MTSVLGKIHSDKRDEREVEEINKFKNLKSELIDKIQSVDSKYHDVSKDACNLKWLYENWDKIMANKPIINLINNWGE